MSSNALKALTFLGFPTSPNGSCIVLKVRRFNYYVGAFDPSVYKICCEMGEENGTKSCPARAYNIESKECTIAFLKCCLKKHGSKGKKVSH